MTGGRIFAVSGLILGISLPPGPTFADPVRITSGAADAGIFALRVNATGERGLAINGLGDANDGTTLPPYCIDCPPGQDFSLDVFTILRGTVSIDDLSFTLGGDGTENAYLELRFSSSVILPEFTGNPVIELSAPFRVEGHTSFPAPGSPVQLFGSGTATVVLEWEPEPPDGTGWSYERLRFEFEPAAPVPEPASLLLIGTGVAALAGVRARRRR